MIERCVKSEYPVTQPAAIQSSATQLSATQPIATPTSAPLHSKTQIM